MRLRSLLATGLAVSVTTIGLAAALPTAGADEPAPLPDSPIALTAPKKLVTYGYRGRVYTNLGLRLVASDAPVEIWCCGLGAVAFAYVSGNAWLMTYDSFLFGDTSPGLMAVPFWIPQIGMSLGAAIMTVGFVDELVQTIGGKIPDFADAEAQAIDEELEAASLRMAGEAAGGGKAAVR